MNRGSPVRATRAVGAVARWVLASEHGFAQAASSGQHQRRLLGQKERPGITIYHLYGLFDQEREHLSRVWA